MSELKAWLLDDDRGVSPVIGVILMVAITVILAAVIATFVMNMGPSESTPANANWDGEFHTVSSANHTFNLTHEGGGAATSSEYVLSVEGASGGSTGSLSPLTSSDHNLASNLSAPNEMTASDTVVLYPANMSAISAGNDLDLSSATIQLIWEDPEGDQSQIINTYEP